MVIYGEILFLENAAAGALLLWMTRRLCSCPIGGKRLALGAALCGLYAFSIFQQGIGSGVALMQKLLFSALLILLSFGRCEGKTFLRRLSVFYAMSFLMGGITMGLAGLIAAPAASFGGSFYLEHMTFLHIVSGCGATLLTVRLTLNFLKERRHRFQTRVSVTIPCGGKELTAAGFIDTGNLLMDPLENRPVCLVGEELGRKLAQAAGESFSPERLRRISYCGAAGDQGTLSVIPAEEIRIHREEGTYSYQVTLAVARDGGRGNLWGKNVDILLHGWLLDEAFGDYKKVGNNHETMENRDDFAS